MTEYKQVIHSNFIAYCILNHMHVIPLKIENFGKCGCAAFAYVLKSYRFCRF